VRTWIPTLALRRSAKRSYRVAKKPAACSAAAGMKSIFVRGNT
jgi:hypothetical protein